MKKALLYLWQLPQNLLGLAIVKSKWVSPSDIWVKPLNSTHYIPVYSYKRLDACVSLGKYIICSPWVTSKDVSHEMGHQKQSLYLGWLYLPLVGLSSALHCWLCPCKNHDYYEFWTEKWADKLAGIRR